jgi:hypothetical protein
MAAVHASTLLSLARQYCKAKAQLVNGLVELYGGDVYAAIASVKGALLCFAAAA